MLMSFRAGVGVTFVGTRAGVKKSNSDHLLSCYMTHDIMFTKNLIALCVLSTGLSRVRCISQDNNSTSYSAMSWTSSSTTSLVTGY